LPKNWIVSFDSAEDEDEEDEEDDDDDDEEEEESFSLASGKNCLTGGSRAKL